MKTIHDRIKTRALEIFDGNGHIFGRELGDWLQAESELIWKPAIELREKDNEFLLQVAVPGVDPKDIDVEITVEDILVKADVRHEHKEEKGKIHVSELTSGSLFRAVHLPKKINPDKVKAEFKDGVLRLTAEFAIESLQRKIAVSASASQK